MSGVSDIAKSLGVKKGFVEDVFEEIFRRVGNGEEVKIKGFGTFRRVVFKGRVLQSPAVNGGDPIKCSDSFVLKFKQTQLAKRKLNTAKD